MRITFLAVHSEETYPSMPKWAFSLSCAYLHAYLTTSPRYPQLAVTTLNFSERHSPEQIAARILPGRPDLLAVSCYLWNIQTVLELLPRLKQEQPQLRVALGGPEIAETSVTLLDTHPEIDFLVAGEGEVTFRALVEHLLTAPQEPPLGLPGVICRDRDGHGVVNPPREKIADLNLIPSPFALGLVDLSALRGGLVALESQRGCVQECAFCNYPKGFGGVRFFDLQRVLDDLERILPHAPKQLYLMDPTFNSNRKRAHAILKTVIRLKQQYGIKKLFLNAEMIPDMLDRETLELAHAAGMSFIESGIQSLHPATVAEMGRRRNEEKLLANLNLALEMGVNLVPQLILGLPGDSKAIFLDNFDRIYALPTQEMHIFRLNLLPGTRYRREADKYGLRFLPHAPYTIVESADFSRAEITFLDHFRVLVALTMQMKESINQACAAMDLPRHRAFTGFVEEVPEEAWAFTHPVSEKGDLDAGMALIKGFANHLTEQLHQTLPPSQADPLGQKVRQGEKRCLWMLNSFFMFKSLPTPCDQEVPAGEGA